MDVPWHAGAVSTAGMHGEFERVDAVVSGAGAAEVVAVALRRRGGGDPEDDEERVETDLGPAVPEFCER